MHAFKFPLNSRIVVDLDVNCVVVDLAVNCAANDLI